MSVSVVVFQHLLVVFPLFLRRLCFKGGHSVIKELLFLGELVGNHIIVSPEVVNVPFLIVFGGMDELFLDLCEVGHEC